MSFSDIFKSSFLESITEFSVIDTIIGLTFAVIIGLFIYIVYQQSFAGVMYSDSFALTLVGLSMVTTLVIMAVTSYVVLSLGMVGALSIVRFRTAIKEPIEIVYLFWALASGIVIGAGMIPLAVIGSVIIGVILVLFANRKSNNMPYILIVKCDNTKAEKEVVNQIKTNVKKDVIKSKTVNDNGIELTYEVRIKDDETKFVNSLQKISGVTSATLVSFNGDYMS